ncbi:MAG: S9 family peptidase, partial [Bacteroidales bacterium]|nr:S9 family peptidase [Bacteroidales bacterium]
MKINFLISLLLLVVLSSSVLAQSDLPKITLDDIWKTGKFNTRGVRGLESMNDGIHYTILERDTINKYRYDNGEKVTTLFHSGLIVIGENEKPPRIDSYSFSKNETKMLLATNTESIYRHSTQADHWVFDIVTQSNFLVSTNGKQRLADFSPDGSKVAFVRDNNLHVKDLVSDEEKQITFDGLARHIINGTTDWVYEEEFGITKGFYWSPDANRIAFLRFDESHVKEFSMTTYGTLYPGKHPYKYPKAGEDNSMVTVHIYNLKTGIVTRVDTGAETDQYIPRIQWTTNPTVLSFHRMNRHQNHLEIILADIENGQNRLLYEERNKYYIEITNDLSFLDDGKRFIITSERDGFNHLYLYDMTGKLLRQLTRGPWEVTSLYGVDQKSDRIFYQAAKASPLQREIYSVSLHGRDDKKLSLKVGTTSARFSTTFDYYVSTFNTANRPSYISVNLKHGSEVRVLQDNTRLLSLIEEYRFSRMEFFTLTTSEGIVLNASMIKPHNFDPAKKYPVFMYVYGGPGSQTVRDAWGGSTNLWFQMLAQNGYIVVSVENRGTGLRGEEFKKMTYLQLGKYETIDQIEAAKYLAGLPYVDGSR